MGSSPSPRTTLVHGLSSTIVGIGLGRAVRHRLYDSHPVSDRGSPETPCNALVSGSPYVLVDQKGYDYRLKSGKNVVGRSDQCDLAVDPEYRAVSRKHVIVEATLGAPVRITDISSLGTFVPREHLDPLLH